VVANSWPLAQGSGFESPWAAWAEDNVDDRQRVSTANEPPLSIKASQKRIGVRVKTKKCI
jgi:hypothetical protein